MSYVILVASLAAILLAAELFTNGVEWLGYRLNLGEGAVGSVLAAVGTAMPETLIPVVAILLGGEAAANEVGIGAILGAPFMLSTLALFVVGLAVILFARSGNRSTRLDVDTGVLARDVGFFLAFYVVAIAAGFIDIAWVKWSMAGLLILGYGFYVYKHFSEEGEGGEHPKHLHTAIWLPRASGRLVRKGPETFLRLYFDEYEIMPAAEHEHHVASGNEPLASITPLYFLKMGVPRMRVIVGQVVLALVLMVVGAHFFVGSVEEISAALGVPALILALIIAPIATELPEKFNSVLWVHAGKDTLALGNVTGAMAFQSCIPAAIGMCFTHWAISESMPALVSALIALGATMIIYGIAWRRRALTAPVMLLGGLFYVGYLVFAITCGG